MFAFKFFFKKDFLCAYFLLSYTLNLNLKLIPLKYS